MREGLIWQTLDDGTVVISVDEGRVRVLNETGTLLWSLIDGRHTLRQLAERLSDSYEGLSIGKAERDVADFVAALVERGLVQLEP